MIQLSFQANVVSGVLQIKYQVSNNTGLAIYLANRFGPHPCSTALQPGSENSASTWLLSGGVLLVHQGRALVPLGEPLDPLPFHWPTPAMTAVAAGAVASSTLSLRTPIEAHSGWGYEATLERQPLVYVPARVKRLRFALDVLTPPAHTMPIEVDGSDAVGLPPECWGQLMRLQFSGELPEGIDVEASPWRRNTPDGDRHATMIDAGRDPLTEESGAHLPRFF